MFETLFKEPAAIERHRTAAMLEDRLAFLTQREANGFTKHTLKATAQYLLVIMDHLRLATRSRELIDAVKIEKAAIRWSKRRKTRTRRSWHTFVGHATRRLTFLGRWKPALLAHKFVGHLSAYSDYMRTERGLSPATVFTRCWTVEDFLPKLKMPLTKLTISHVDATVADRFGGKTYARSSVHAYVGVLRNFFALQSNRDGVSRG